MSQYSIVRILDARELLDEANRRHPYTAPGGTALSAGGYYAVLWPDDRETVSYDDGKARFVGPYAIPYMVRLDVERQLTVLRSLVAPGGR